MRYRALATCVWIIVAIGAFLFSSGLLDYWESRYAQNEIASKWTETPSREPGSAIPEGSSLAKLSIPRLDATFYVVEGTDAESLKRGPGHLEGSAMPGQSGNCVIAGHRDTHFRVLKDIRAGDEVLLERDGHEFRYRVDGSQIVMPTDTHSLQPTSEAVLHLITCYPFYYLGSAPKRFIVHAALESAPLSASR
ncbi:MAG TPA: class D sortase [Bryobacteraceae bacterium]|nr:class D sortase [Bryobacteraceae bacterium]